jgi:tripartite-type tricarboxylate transporter receptor subunit TctC
MTLKRREFLSVLAAASGAGALGVSPALAQAFPSKPVRVVVASGAGGASDIVARMIQRAVARTSPQPFVVANMPGGGTSIGGREVANAAPDGHTVLMMHEALIVATAQGIFKPGVEDLTPLAVTGRDIYTIVVNGTSPFRTLKDLYDAARTRSVRTAVNIGGLNHFTSLIAAESAKVEIRPVQHGSGADSVRSLLGNQVEVIFAVPSDVIEYQKAGQMRILGIMSEQRSAYLPDVPTTAEAGFPSISDLNHMWWVPKATPADRVTWLRGQLKSAMDEAEVRSQLTTRMIETTFLSGADVDAHVAQKRAEIQMLVDKFGLRQN